MLNERHGIKSLRESKVSCFQRLLNISKKLRCASSITIKHVLTFLNKRDILRCYNNDIETLEKDRDTLKYLVICPLRFRFLAFSNFGFRCWRHVTSGWKCWMSCATNYRHTLSRKSTVQRSPARFVVSVTPFSAAGSNHVLERIG